MSDAFDASGANTPGLAEPAPLSPRGSNHLGMRQFNERIVLRAIRVHGGLPKAEIARLTGLTAQTIGQIATSLEDDGLLLRGDAQRGRVGQPSIPMEINPDGAFAIGVKVGRRSADWLLIDFLGRVKERLSTQYESPDALHLLPLLEQNIRALTERLGPRADRLVGVGVATPFQMGGWHRMIGLSAAQAETWNRIDLAAQVRAMTDAPVSFAKDTAAACIAELEVGRGRDLRNFLYLFVDTFVGGGLVLNSQPHLGINGNAGAVASLPMQLGGLGGQLVAHASLWELEQRLRARGFDPAMAYDERALAPELAEEVTLWLAHAANGLALCITSGSAFLDIGAVVIDGSLCTPLLNRLIERTREALTRYNWEGLFPTEVHAGSLGSDARALGGALLPLHAHFSPDSDVFLKRLEA